MNPLRSLPQPTRRRNPVWEYVEVVCVTAVVTFIGRISPLTYQAFDDVYLLMITALCFRVGRIPVLVAGVLSACAYFYFIIPPQYSLEIGQFEDGLLLGTYVVVALLGGQLVGRLREQELEERRRVRETTALYHLTQAFAATPALTDALAIAVNQADMLFEGATAVLLVGEDGVLVLHSASTFNVKDAELQVAQACQATGVVLGKYTGRESDALGHYVPLIAGSETLGVMALALPADMEKQMPKLQDLIATFASQIAFFVERDRLRAISEREKLLIESERLQRTLLDSVSHELKTPLAVLRSASNALGSESADRRATLANEIRTATRRLDRLVANLLNQTRLESGAVKPLLDWCDVRDVIANARREMSAALASTSLVMDVPEDMPLIRADAALMEQVIGNLILNAAVHTPKATPISLRAGLLPGGSRVFVAVEDRGPGISAEMQANLFQKFVRQKGAPTGGMGLGLSIVRGFMVAQGGEVSYEAVSGGGSRFTVTLPHVANESVPFEE